jgi:hypothetical protein
MIAKTVRVRVLVVFSAAVLFTLSGKGIPFVFAQQHVYAQSSLDGTWNWHGTSCFNGNCNNSLYGIVTFQTGSYIYSITNTGDSQRGTYTYDGQTLNFCSNGGTGNYNKVGCTPYSVTGGDGIGSLEYNYTHGNSTGHWNITIHMTKA